VHAPKTVPPRPPNKPEREPQSDGNMPRTVTTDKENWDELVADQKALKELRKSQAGDHLDNCEKLLKLKDMVAEYKAQEKELKTRISELETDMHRANRTGNSQGEEIVALRSNYDQVRQENKSLKAQVRQLQEVLNSSSGEDNGQLENLKAEIHYLQLDKKELVTKLQQAIEALRQSGQRVKFEESKEMIREIRNWIRDVGFINTKFVLTPSALTDFATEVYEGLADRMGLNNPDEETYVTKDEFLRVYSAATKEILNEIRQYCQTKLRKAVLGKLLDFLVYFIKCNG
jgi:chromosome segregation ATPase